MLHLIKYLCGDNKIDGTRAFLDAQNYENSNSTINK